LTSAITSRPARLKQTLANTWLYPRYIGTVYMRDALGRASEYARGVMLDIGCGLRPYEEIFAPRVTRYIGMDYPVTLDKARMDVMADALRLPVSDESVDTVLATELLEHLPDPIQFIRQVARVLRSSGVFIFSVPFMEPLHEEPRDFYRFTPYSLRLMLEHEGFAVRHVWPKGGWWSVVLGSFFSQGLYDFANPINRQDGTRSDGPARFFVLPFCAAAQWAGYTLDRLFKESRYTLGYVVVAALENRRGQSEAAS
jgi:SAM-dependent methyltransferase